VDIEVQSLIDSLKNELDSYKKTRPRLSWRSIAKLSKVNRYFINKILQDDGQADSSKMLDLTQALRLIKFLHEKSAVKYAIDSSGSALREAFQNAFPIMYETLAGTEERVEVEDVDLSDFNTFSILVLASLYQGTSRRVVQQVLGEKALLTLQALFDAGKLVETGGGVITLEMGYCLPYRAQFFQQHGPEFLSRFYSPQLFDEGRKRNYSSMYIEKLHEQAAQELYQIHKDFHKKVVNLMEAPQNHGDIHVFSISCFDTLLPPSQKENSQYVQ
jgi:hypothetical protein